MRAQAGKSGKILSQNMVSQMLTVQHGSLSLGLFIQHEGKDFYFGHGGSNEGFRCTFLSYPEKGQGAAIMTNSDNGGYLMQEILRSLSAE